MKKVSDDFAEVRNRISLNLLPGLVSINQLEDGEGVMMKFKHDNLPGQLQVKAMLTGDILDYPKGTGYVFFTDDANSLAAVTQLLVTLSDEIVAASIVEMAVLTTKPMMDVLHSLQGGKSDMPADNEKNEGGPSNQDNGEQSGIVPSIPAYNPPRGMYVTLPSGREVFRYLDPSRMTVSDALIIPGMTNFRPGRLNIGNLWHHNVFQGTDPNVDQELRRQLEAVKTMQLSVPQHELGWYLDFEYQTDIYQWIVELHSFDPEKPLAGDMSRCDIPSVALEMRFPRSFPIRPPFVRVVRPRFLPTKLGGGGPVTMNGAVCMELLTMTGWKREASMTDVLNKIRQAFCDDTHPARLYNAVPIDDEVALIFDSQGCYALEFALEDYREEATKRGWGIPRGIDSVCEKHDPWPAQE